MLEKSLKNLLFLDFRAKGKPIQFDEKLIN